MGFLATETVHSRLNDSQILYTHIFAKAWLCFIENIQITLFIIPNGVLSTGTGHTRLNDSQILYTHIFLKTWLCFNENIQIKLFIIINGGPRYRDCAQ